MLPTYPSPFLRLGRLTAATSTKCIRATKIPTSGINTMAWLTISVLATGKYGRKDSMESLRMPGSRVTICSWTESLHTAICKCACRWTGYMLRWESLNRQGPQYPDHERAEPMLTFPFLTYLSNWWVLTSSRLTYFGKMINCTHIFSCPKANWWALKKHKTLLGLLIISKEKSSQWLNK